MFTRGICVVILLGCVASVGQANYYSWNGAQQDGLWSGPWNWGPSPRIQPDIIDAMVISGGPPCTLDCGDSITSLSVTDNEFTIDSSATLTIHMTGQMPTGRVGIGPLNTDMHVEMISGTINARYRGVDKDDYSEIDDYGTFTLSAGLEKSLSFDHEDGTINAGQFNVGDSYSSHGALTYVMVGGAINAFHECIDTNTGETNFTQFGGTNTVDYGLTIGWAGGPTYTLRKEAHLVVNAVPADGDGVGLDDDTTSNGCLQVYCGLLDHRGGAIQIANDLRIRGAECLIGHSFEGGRVYGAFLQARNVIVETNGTLDAGGQVTISNDLRIQDSGQVTLSDRCYGAGRIEPTTFSVLGNIKLEGYEPELFQTGNHVTVAGVLQVSCDEGAYGATAHINCSGGPTAGSVAIGQYGAVGHEGLLAIGDDSLLNFYYMWLTSNSFIPSGQSAGCAFYFGPFGQYTVRDGGYVFLIFTDGASRVYVDSGTTVSDLTGFHHTELNFGPCTGAPEIVASTGDGGLPTSATYFNQDSTLAFDKILIGTPVDPDDPDQTFPVKAMKLTGPFALYVKTLTFEVGGTFAPLTTTSLLDHNVYYLNGGDPKQLFPGDANLDGVVSFKDYIVLESQFGHTNTKWTNADFNGDGTVDFKDYVILEANFGSGLQAIQEDSASEQNASTTRPQTQGQASATSSVAEPTTLPALTDLNGDGKIDNEDMKLLIDRIKEQRATAVTSSDLE